MDLIQQGFLSLLGWTFSYGPFLAALLLAIVLPTIVVLVSTFTYRLQPSTRLFLILGTIVVGGAASIGLSGRVLLSQTMLAQSPWLALQVDIAGGELRVRISQLSTLIVLALCSAELLAWMNQRVRMAPGVRSLWLAVLAFYLISIPISGLAGTWRETRLSEFYAPLVFTALALLAPGADARFWRLMRWPIFLICASSLLLMWVKPDLVVEGDFISLIPGFPKRLHGLSGHANAMGMLAAIGVLLELSDFVRRRPNLLFLLASLGVLVLAQSKTAWIAAMAGLFIVRWSWFKGRLHSDDPWYASAALIAASCFFVAVAICVFSLGSGAETAEIFITENNITNLTGRTRIWAVTLDEFSKSPLLGYGPSIWDLRFRADHRMLYVGQAHNQVIQTLGQAGVLGLLALIVQLVALGRASLVGWAGTRGLAAVMFVILLARCATEAPLTMSGVMGADPLFQMLCFVAAGYSVFQYRAQQGLLPQAGSRPKGRAALAPASAR